MSRPISRKSKVMAGCSTIDRLRGATLFAVAFRRVAGLSLLTLDHFTHARSRLVGFKSHSGCGDEADSHADVDAPLVHEQIQLERPGGFIPLRVRGAETSFIGDRPNRLASRAAVCQCRPHFIAEYVPPNAPSAAGIISQ